MNEIIYDDGQTLVVQTQNNTFVLDAIDRDLLNIHWEQYKHQYPVANKNMILHQEVAKRMNGGVKFERVLHLNYDKTDCRRSNLADRNNHEVVIHQKAYKKRAEIHSKYKGVVWSPHHNKWKAQSYRLGKRYYGGYYVDELEAAKAADTLGRKIHGELYTINIYEETK